MTSRLPIATEGPCKGHPCDNCATCRKGRCCRRDNPEYKLPDFGEWNGPVWGKPAVLDENSDGVECHCCGERFKVLGRHTLVAHDLTTAEYKAIFGFCRTFGLSCESSKQKHRMEGRRKAKIHGRILPQLTAEQRSHVAGQPKRLQGRRINGESHRENVRTGAVISGGAKLTLKDVLDIKRINPANPVDRRALAKRYGVCDKTIRNILSGQHWSYINLNERLAS